LQRDCVKIFTDNKQSDTELDRYVAYACYVLAEIGCRRKEASIISVEQGGKPAGETQSIRWEVDKDRTKTASDYKWVVTFKHVAKFKTEKPPSVTITSVYNGIEALLLKTFPGLDDLK
jgi:hypothetical protein